MMMFFVEFFFSSSNFVVFSFFSSNSPSSSSFLLSNFFKKLSSYYLLIAGLCVFNLLVFLWPVASHYTYREFEPPKKNDVTIAFDDQAICVVCAHEREDVESRFRGSNLLETSVRGVEGLGPFEVCVGVVRADVYRRGKPRRVGAGRRRRKFDRSAAADATQGELWQERQGGAGEEEEQQPGRRRRRRAERARARRSSGGARRRCLCAAAASRCFCL